MVDLTLPDVAPAQDSADAGRRLVARVLAWQHRHPLARRIAPGEVGGLGVIALPYGLAVGAGGDAAPLFHQPGLLPGLSHRALVAFAARHAVGQRPGPADWPQRDIERTDPAPGPAPQMRYLLTAAIPGPRGATLRRVLLAPAGAAIWGRRPLDRARLGAAALLALAALALVGWAWTSAPARRSGSVAPRGVPAAASAVAAAASVPAVAPVPVGSAPAEAASVAPPPAAAIASAVASAAPAPLLPMPGRTASAATEPASSPAGPAAAPPGPHFALVSVPSRKRADAEATLQRVRQLLGPAIGTLQVQVMSSPQGFVVTLWPLPTQADAERMAEVMARRGVPMKWLEF